MANRRSSDYDNLQARTVVVRNLAKDVTTELLKELFMQGGPVRKVVMPHNSFAFIEFEDAESVGYSMALFDGVELKGRPLECKPKLENDRWYYTYQIRLQQWERNPSVHNIDWIALGIMPDSIEKAANSFGPNSASIGPPVPAAAGAFEVAFASPVQPPPHHPHNFAQASYSPPIAFANQTPPPPVSYDRRGYAPDRRYEEGSRYSHESRHHTPPTRHDPRYMSQDMYSRPHDRRGFDDRGHDRIHNSFNSMPNMPQPPSGSYRPYERRHEFRQSDGGHQHKRIRHSYQDNDSYQRRQSPDPDRRWSGDRHVYRSGHQ